MKMMQAALLFLGAVWLAGCGSAQGDFGAETATLAGASGDATAHYEEGLKHWVNRANRADAEAAIVAWNKAAAVDAQHLETQMSLAYAAYFLSNVHLRWEDEDEVEEQLKETYRAGMKAGLRAIELASPEFASAIKAGKSWDEAIPSVGKSGLPAMYWYATNLAKWGLLEGITTILKYKDRIFAIMSHCRDLDPNFWHGGPHRYFGAYWLKIPFGKDADASREGFTKSIAISPNYLDTKILYAQYYAVYTGDEGLFTETLNAVVGATDDVIPELQPENANARRVAADMLANMDDYF